MHWGFIHTTAFKLSACSVSHSIPVHTHHVIITYTGRQTSSCDEPGESQKVKPGPQRPNRPEVVCSTFSVFAVLKDLQWGLSGLMTTTENCPDLKSVRPGTHLQSCSRRANSGCRSGLCSSCPGSAHSLGRRCCRRSFCSDLHDPWLGTAQHQRNTLHSSRYSRRLRGRDRFHLDLTSTRVFVINTRSQQMSVSTCVQEHVSRNMCPGACVQEHVSRSMCPGACVQEHVSRSMCPGTCVQEHVSRSMCPGTCVQEHVSRSMCDLRRHSLELSAVARLHGRSL